MRIGSNTRLAAVLGWPVSHSQSPAMHNAAFAAAGIDAVYLALPVAPGDLDAAVAGLRAIGLVGANLTVPHKRAVLASCDALSPAAEAIGAVNTLEFSQTGQVIGHNTDAPGYVRAFEDTIGRDLRGARVVVLGGGGAARAVARGVRDGGALSVKVIARSPNKVDWVRALAWTAEVLDGALSNCDLLVDCTSVGLSAETESQLPAPLPLERLPEHAVVSTLVYHRKTALLAQAESRGLSTLDGAGMLLHQGALSFSIWTGVEAPIEAMRAALSI